MSKLDDLLLEVGIGNDRIIKSMIKSLILDLFKEAEYEPYAFVEKIEEL